MNLRDRARRSLILVAALSVIFASGAFADTQIDQTSTNVGVMSLEGQRGLQITGAPSGSPIGSPNLSFGAVGAAQNRPFGVVVTDAMYSRVDYYVQATLSNLWDTGCEQSIPASAFSVVFDDTTGTEDIVADVTGALMTFSGTVDGTLADLNVLLGGILTDPIDVVVDYTDFAPEDGFDLPALNLMSVADGDGSPGTFTNAADGPCGDTPGDLATDVDLQYGEPGETEEAIAGAIFDLFDEQIHGATSGSLTTDEAMDTDLLPDGADEEGGILYDAIKATLNESGALLTALGTLGLDLDDLVDAILTNEDLGLDRSELSFATTRQSGVYFNVPSLRYDPTLAGNPPAGSYTGTLTVTLFDDD